MHSLSWTIITLLLAVASGGQSGATPPPGPDIKEMRAAALIWLQAFAKGDHEGLLLASDEVLSVYGFDMVTGESRQRCAEDYPGFRVKHDIRLGGTAATPDGVRRLIACVGQDRVAQAGLCGGECMPNTESIAIMTPSRMRRIPAKYRKALVSLPEGTWLRMPRQEKDGVAVSALVLVVVGSKQITVVRAVILETKFTE